jgi:uncharacterized protein
VGPDRAAGRDQKPRAAGRDQKPRPAGRDPTRRAATHRDWVRRAAWLVFVLALTTFLLRGADRPRDPRLLPAGSSIPSRRVPGFSEIGFVVGRLPPVPTAGRHTFCALLATTAAQQQKGLMNRRDLAGYDGMVFRFDRPTTVSFYMKDTLIPLSIAWFDSGGRYLNALSMAPCPKSAVTCRLYRADAPYTVAIEVRAGGLPQLGIGPGSTITVGGPC